MQLDLGATGCDQRISTLVAWRDRSAGPIHLRATIFLKIRSSLSGRHEATDTGLDDDSSARRELKWFWFYEAERLLAILTGLDQGLIYAAASAI
jgi:hypothetical protein